MMNRSVVTKRQLGVFLVVVSLLLVGAAIAVDWLGAGEWSGFGPLQWIALVAGLVLVAIGGVLIRIGRRPA
ncbi:MAG: hypothetical protein JW900_06025 [Anaerolineae bacterium]|nr:hypothetical protein [Anaerolineae bacterium]